MTVLFILTMIKKFDWNVVDDYGKKINVIF